MNMLYTEDVCLLKLGDYSDPIIDPFSLSSDLHSHSSPSSPTAPVYIPRTAKKSPPRHRHDGTSPLPLGMDWSLPPRLWNGKDTIWPHDPPTGWSYCVTIPSWISIPKSRASDHVVLYRVRVGMQSPDGITTVRWIFRRYSDFLKLVSELKKAFPEKNIPPAPPKRILRIRNRMTLLEERRCALEDWMEKLLSDIDVSRSALVGTFLELEAAARLSFEDANEQNSEETSFVNGMASSILQQSRSDVSLLAGTSSIASDYGNNSSEEVSEIGTPRHETESNVEFGMETSTSEPNIAVPTGTIIRSDFFNRSIILGNLRRFSNWKLGAESRESMIGREKSSRIMPSPKASSWDDTQSLPELEYPRLDGHVRKLSTESVGSDLSSVRACETSNLGNGALDLLEGNVNQKVIDPPGNTNVQFPKDSLVVLPTEERQKLGRVLSTVQQRLATARTDMNDLMSRLNQEVAMRQFLTTKVKDLEVDLETTKSNCRDNMQQAVLTEKEKFTQMQWDIEELRRQCFELDLRLKSEQDEKARAEAAKLSIIRENKILLQQLDIAREEFGKLHKEHEELELKSKADVKLLVKEVKSLRSYQSELKQDLSRLMKEKLETEKILQKEKQRTERVSAANVKLLHECDLLYNRLQECSVNFLSEEDDKLNVDTSSPSDAIDLLTTSDNRIGLLLAEAQLLAQDVENSLANTEVSPISDDGSNATDDKLRKMLTEIFVDNARLRMQVNAVVCYALSTLVKSDQDDDDEEEEDELPLRKTVLSKLLER